VSKPRCDIHDARAHRCAVLFKKYGIGVKFVTSDDPAAFEAAIDEKTKAVFVETIGNPKYNVSPISEIAKV
jgi:O-acetylhomoserine/O-acetylserine sulfhydrylase